MGIRPIARMPTSNSVCVTEAKKRKEPEAIVDEAEEELSSVKKVKLERSLDLAHAKITTSKTHNTAILISSDIELPESDSDSDVQVIEHASSTIATKSSQADDAVSNTSSFSSSSCIVITRPQSTKRSPITTTQLLPWLSGQDECRDTTPFILLLFGMDGGDDCALSKGKPSAAPNVEKESRNYCIDEGSVRIILKKIIL